MNINRNFLDQYSEEDIQDVYEDVLEPQHDDETSQVLSEAIKRIEQAKLYEAMLNHNFFAQGSARQEIIDAVTKEFKTFILHRLEVLLGIKQEAASAPQGGVFSPEEVDALRALASRLIEPKKRETAPLASPSVNQVPVSAPKINQVSAAQPSVNQVPMPMQQKAAPTAPAKRKVRKTKSESLSDKTGQDYSQVVSRVTPPLKMPSQAEIDQMNARQAAMNSAVHSASADPTTGKLISSAIALSQQANKNVVEE